METVLTIDVGTSSLRIIIWDLKGKKMFTSQKEYSMEFNNLFVEQSSETWKQALIDCLKGTKQFIDESKPNILAISVTSQRASVIPVDNNCKPLSKAIMWQDKRSLKQCKEIEASLGIEKIYRKTGLRIDPYFSLPKILWLKENSVDVFSATSKVIGVQDYIIYQLTGEFVTDWTQASRTMLLNIEKFEWDEEILDTFAIKRNLLCDLVPPGSIVGSITDEISEISGIKKGTPVVIAGGDQQCAAIALNTFSVGNAEVNTGTGSFIIVHAEQPVFDDKIRTLCSASAIPGKWVSEAGMFTTGSIYRWFKEQFYEQFGKDAYDVLDREVEKAPIGSNGVVILPHFEGSAAPYWNPFAKGLIFNLTLGTKRWEIARAILEGITVELKSNLGIIEENLGGYITSVSIAGGMTKLDSFNQMQADAFNKRVVKYDNVEASALGAAISATVAIKYYSSYEEAFKNMSPVVEKVYEPVQENAIKYQKLMERKNLLYKALDEYKLYNLFSEPL